MVDPARPRDVFLQLAVTELFKAKKSDVLVRNEPHCKHAELERTRDLMDNAFPALPGPGNRRARAGAIVSCCDASVSVKGALRFPTGVVEFLAETRCTKSGAWIADAPMACSPKLRSNTFGFRSSLKRRG